ncbi:hypothetical protein DB88DRAFT_512224 [Papiliotrema laurentii]|uniref:Phosphatidylinositol N-acetylglucosaminyltransferase subunit H conserved domain-containing protein n=1 Tax=Papiliotrema laurentii TaxID=5418 RepID=A0AAD9FKJ5_PAPLA|nr:hypothetical protein DB88DRAFT_512224 [Papiliotrema laurentii]
MSARESSTTGSGQGDGGDCKRVQQPLMGHAELQIVSERVGDQGWVDEYRVYDFRTLPSGRIARSNRWGGWDWLLASAIVWLLWRVDWDASRSACKLGSWTGCLEHLQKHSPTTFLAAFFILVLAGRSRMRMYQSITPLPGLGLQLSTTKYLAIPWVHTSTPIVLSTSKTFIPLSEISTVVINEGLTRWSVRYFLAVVQRGGTGIHIAFKDVRPRHAVLREVYHGIREQLFDEWADD